MSWFSQPLLPLAIILQTPDISNVVIDEGTFLACRPHVFLGDSSNQPVEGVPLPEVLERLPLRDNQSVRNALRSPALKTLEFVSPIFIMLW